MKISASNPWDTSNQSASQPLTVDEDSISKIIGLLSKNIYSSKASAFREYWLNARESHQAARAAGCSPRPMEITLPSTRDTLFHSVNSFDDIAGKYQFPVILSTPDNLFRIRDYGVGMDRDTLVSMVSSAGASSKTNTDEYGGGMGIGSLSGFSVSDQIVIRAYKDGKTSTVILSADSHAWSVLDELDTTEPDGVEVSFLVSNAEASYEFSMGAMEYLVFSGDKDMVVTCGDRGVFYAYSGLDSYSPQDAVERYSATARINNHVVKVSSQDNTMCRGRRGAYHGNPLLRIDGCLYDMYTQEEFKAVLTDKIINTINSRVANTEYHFGDDTISGRYVDKYIINDVASVSTMIVDAPVGVFNQNIQPNRETVSLDGDVLNALADAILPWFEEHIADTVRFLEAVEKVKDCWGNSPSVTDSTLSTIPLSTGCRDMRIEELSEFFYTASSVNRGIANLVSYQGSSKPWSGAFKDTLFTCDITPRGFTYASVAACYKPYSTSFQDSDAEYKGTHNAAGFLLSEVANNDGLVAYYAVNLKNDQRIEIEYEGTARREDIIVLESTTQRMTAPVMYRELINPYNEKVADNKKEFEGKTVLVNTPLMDRVIMRNKCISHKFHNTDAIITPDKDTFTSFRKKANALLNPKKKKNVVKYEVEETTAFTENMDVRSTESTFGTLTVDDIAAKCDDGAVVFLDTYNDGKSMSNVFQRENSIKHLRLLFHDKPLLIVSPRSASQRFDKMAERMRGANVEHQLLHTVDALSIAADRLSSEDKRNLAVFYAAGRDFVNNPVSVESLAYVLSAVGKKDLAASVRDVFQSEDTPSVRNSVTMLVKGENLDENTTKRVLGEKNCGDVWGAVSTAVEVLHCMNITHVRTIVSDEDSKQLVGKMFTSLGK